MDSFIRGIKEGSAGRLGSRVVAPLANIPKLPEADTPDPFALGIATALSGGEMQQPEAPAPLPPMDGFADIGRAAMPEFELPKAENIFENPVQKPPQDGTYNVTWETREDGGRSYSNFPMQDVTLDEVTPSLYWTMEEHRLGNNQVSDYIFGTRYVPKLDENGFHAKDANGNEIWVLNPEENWTEEDWRKKELAEGNMGVFNQNLAMLRENAEQNGWDFTTDNQVLENQGFLESPLMEKVFTGLEYMGVPNEWAQNKAADSWYRKNILGEDVAWHDSFVENSVIGGSGVGNFGGGVLSWLTPGTENTTPTFDGFNEWAENQDPEILKRLYNDGWDPDNDGENIIYGGAAIWDYYAYHLTNSQKFFIDTGTDPLSLAPTVGKALRIGGYGVHRAGTKIAHEGSGAILRGTGKTLDNIGRGVISADDAVGTIFMRPLVGTIKLPVRAARMASGRWGDEVVAGWNAGRMNVHGEDIMADARYRSTDPDVIEEFGPSGDPLNMDMARRWTFDKEVMGDDFVPLDPGGRARMFNPETLTRVERTFHDLAEYLNQAPAKRTVGRLVGWMDDLLYQQEFQRQGNAGLEDRARNVDVLDRQRDSVLRANDFDPDQLAAHNRMVRGGKHPLIRDLSNPASREQLRLEYEDEMLRVDQEALQGMRSEILSEVSEALESLGTGSRRGQVDFDEPIENVFKDLGYLAPQGDRAARGYEDRRIEKIDQILQKEHPNARSEFFQEYRRVVKAFRKAGLIAESTTDGYVSPREARMSQFAIEAAWQRTFGDQPRLQSRLPKYEYKSFQPGTPQHRRRLEGNHAINSAYEYLVHGNDMEARSAFIYLRQIPGYESMADEADAIRWAMNAFHDDMGMQGSRVMRNMESDPFFTNQAPTRDWDPNRTLTPEYTVNKPAREPRGFEGSRPEEWYAPGSASAAPGAPTAPTPTPDPNASIPAGLRDPGRPYRPRQNESAPVSVRQQVAEALREDGVDERVAEVRQALAEGTDIPHADPVPDPEPTVYELPEDHIPVREPDPREVLLEVVQDPVDRIFQKEISAEETIADAHQRLSVMRATGMISEDEYAYWYYRESGQDPVKAFKHLSMIAQRNSGVYPESDPLFNLSTPLDRLPKSSFRIPKPSKEYGAEVRQALELATRNDNIAISEKVMRAIEEGTIGSDALGGLDIPELGAPDYVLARFANDIRALDGGDQILRDAGVVVEGQDALNIAVRVMFNLTSGRNWPKSLGRMLDAIGMSVTEDLARSGRFGYTKYVEGATNRLVTLARNAVAGHYLSKGVRPEDVAKIVQSSLREIDEYAEGLLSASTMRQKEFYRARSFLRDNGYLTDKPGSQVWIDRSSGRSQVIAEIPELGISGNYHSYSLLVQAIARASNKRLEWAPDNAIDFGVDNRELINGRHVTPKGWRGEGNVYAEDGTVSIAPGASILDTTEVVEGTKWLKSVPFPGEGSVGIGRDPFPKKLSPADTQQMIREYRDVSEINRAFDSKKTVALNQDIWDMPADRLAGEINSVRDTLRAYQKEYSSWSITAIPKDQYLADPGDAFHRHLQDLKDTGMLHKDAQEKLYKEVRDETLRLQQILRIYDRVVDYQSANGELTSRQLRGIRPTVDDPRQMRKRTPMQERAAQILETSDEVKHRDTEKIRNLKNWVAYYQARGDTKNAASNQARLDALLKGGSNSVVVGDSGYSRLVGTRFRNARNVNKQILLADEVRDQWNGTKRFMSEGQMEFYTGWITAIHKSMPELKEMYEEWDRLTLELEKAPLTRGAKGPRNQYLSRPASKKAKQQRADLEKRIADIENGTGITEIWNRMVSEMDRMDEILKIRIDNARRSQIDDYEAIKKAILNGKWKNKREKINKLDEDYFGTWRDPVKGIREKNGLISRLDQEYEAIMLDQGYGPLDSSGRRGKRDMRQAYRLIQARVGKFYPSDRNELLRRDLLLIDHTLKKAADEDVATKRRRVRQLERAGADLTEEQEALLQEMDAERAMDTFKRPGDVRLANSPSQMLETGADELLPQAGPMAANNHMLAAQEYQRMLDEGRDPKNMPTRKEIFQVLEEADMKEAGYKWLDHNIYLPGDHKILRDGILEGVGSEFHLYYNGEHYHDVYELFEVYPELEDLTMSGTGDLARSTNFMPGDGQMRDPNRLEPDEIPMDNWGYSFNELDLEIYANFDKTMKMSPQDRENHLKGKVREILTGDNEELKDLLQLKALYIRQSEYTSLSSTMATPDPIEASMIEAIWATVRGDGGPITGGPVDFAPERVIAALENPNFGRVLEEKITPKASPEKIEAPKVAINSKWKDEDLDSVERYKAAMRKADSQVDADTANLPVSDRAHPGWTGEIENPYGVGHRLYWMFQTFSPGDKKIWSDALQGKRKGIPSEMATTYKRWIALQDAGHIGKGEAVTQGELEMALRAIRNPETFDNGNMGIMFHSKFAIERMKQDAIEDAERIVRRGIIERAEIRFAAETEGLQKEADALRRKAAGNRKNEDGDWVLDLDESDYRKVSPIEEPDRYHHDDRSVIAANTTIKADNYWKGHTYFEAYKGIRDMNIRNGKKLIDLMNKEKTGSLTNEEYKTMERLTRQFEPYGQVWKENPHRGQVMYAPTGVAKATQRSGTRTHEIRDMRTYVINPDFAMDNVSRQKITDLLMHDRVSGAVAPRWRPLAEKYDQFTSWWSRNKLLNPLNIFRFLSMNMVGDYGQMLFTGNADAVAYSLKTLTSKEMRALFREAGAGGFNNIYDTELGKLIYNAGIGPNVGAIRGSMTGTMSKHLDARTREIFEDGELAPLRKEASNVFTKWRDTASAMSTALEWNRRYAMFYVDFQRRMKQRHNALPLEILDRAEKMGISNLDPDEIRIMVKDLGYGASTSEIYDRMVRLGGARSSAETGDLKKWADRVARDWANTQRKTMDASVEKVNRVLFSYEMNDIDELVRRFMPFHFWATRALPLYAEIAMRNPYLVSAYFRAANAMERDRQQGNTPSWMNNVMEFFMSPAGYASFTNPMSAIGMISLFSDAAKSEGVDDETFLGFLTRIAGDYGGVNLYPWFSSALNMSGWLGDTNRGLDPTGFSRERRFIGGIVQGMVTSGILPMDPVLLGKPFEQRLREGRAWLSKVIPGGATIETTNANASNEVSFQALMENIIRERDGMSPTEPLSVNQQEEIVLAWENPDDWLYQEALDQYTKGNLINNVYNSVVPMYLTIQPENSPYLDLQGKVETPVPQGVGKPPAGIEDSRVTQEDQIWLDAWYRATGEEYKEGDLDQWKKDSELRSDLMWLTPEAQKMVIHRYKFDNLGTAEQIEVRNTYYQIRDGNLPSHGTLTITPEKVIGYRDVNNMSRSEREALADEWLRVDDTRYDHWQKLNDLRKSYSETNPAWNEFKAWQSGLYEYDNLASYRSQVSKDNPNAARYFAEQRADLVRRYGTDIEKINEQLDWRTRSLEAYLAIHGYRYNKSDPDPLSTGDAESSDPVNNPRESQGSGGYIGKANDYLTETYGTTVRIENLPPALQVRLIQLLPLELQQPVADELGG